MGVDRPRSRPLVRFGAGLSRRTMVIVKAVRDEPDLGSVVALNPVLMRSMQYWVELSRLG